MNVLIDIICAIFCMIVFCVGLYATIFTSPFEGLVLMCLSVLVYSSKVRKESLEYIENKLYNILKHTEANNIALTDIKNLLSREEKRQTTSEAEQDQ